jgi:hypothetical protein
MTDGLRRISQFGIASILAVLILLSPTALAPANLVEVAGDSAVGKNSLAMPGSQDMIRDAFGKYIVVYADSAGQLSLAIANRDPMDPGAWQDAGKLAPTLAAYRRPALVLTSPLTLRVLAEGGTGEGHIVDIPVTLMRDLAGNIVSISYGSPRVLATSAQYLSAIVAHDGSVIAAWNSVVPGVSSTVFARRWSFSLGWTSVSNPLSGAPDTVLLDTVETAAIQANVIERPDTFDVYVIGNRGERSNQTTLVFNSGSYTGSGWTWGTQNLTYETNASKGLADSTDLVWDPVRSAVVVTYDISQTQKYGVIRIDASGSKVHLDTPHLNITNNEWGLLQVNPRTGDYCLFLIDTPVSPPWGEEYGAVAYTVWTNGTWSRTPTWIDNETNNMAMSALRPMLLGSGSIETLEVLYVKGKTAPATIMFVRLDM